MKLFLLGLMAAFTFAASAQTTFHKDSTVRYLTYSSQLRYATNQAGTFTSRTLVDKNYVDSADRPFKAYTALITQASTTAPTDVVLENRLSGAITWARTGVGVYTGTLAGAFVNNKTFLSVTNNNGAAIDLVVQRTDANTITLKTFSGGAATDGLLSGTPVEVRVYN